MPGRSLAAERVHPPLEDGSSLPARLGRLVASGSVWWSPFGAAGAPYRSIPLRGFTTFGSSRGFLVDQNDVEVDQNVDLVDQNVGLVDQNFVLVVQKVVLVDQTDVPVDQKDLLVMEKHLIDFLTSFRDFEELSFFFRSSGDSFVRSFFLTF